MKRYRVTTPDKLRSLCIKNNWFTCGTNAQYEKLFYANETNATIEEIVAIIWVCSEECDKTAILAELRKAEIEYENVLYGLTDLY